MYKFEDVQITLMCRISILLQKSPSCFAKDIVLWYHKNGIVKIDFREKEMSIPTYPDDEILFLTLWSMGKSLDLEMYEVDYED